MEIAIWIVTGIIVLLGVVLIFVLLRMILTGDYTIVFDHKEDRVVRTRRRVSPDLQVAHFVKETAGWTSDAERKRAAQELLELRLRSRQKQRPG